MFDLPVVSALTLKGKLIIAAVIMFIMLIALAALYFYIDGLKDDIKDLQVEVSQAKEELATEKAHSTVIAGKLESMITLGRAIVEQSKVAHQEYKEGLAKATKNAKSIQGWTPKTKLGECDAVKELISDYRSGALVK